MYRKLASWGYARRLNAKATLAEELFPGDQSRASRESGVPDGPCGVPTCLYSY